VDFPVAGIDWLDKLEESVLLLNFSSGVSYRPYRFLQLCASFHTIWTEFQMGDFDPAAVDYDNTDILPLIREIQNFPAMDLNTRRNISIFRPSMC